MLASTIIPTLIKKGKGNNSIFFEMKIKYPELFKRKNYPLSNIFINNLLKNKKYFSGSYSKDKTILLDDNRSLIYNTNDSSKNSGHWCSIPRSKDIIYIFDSIGVSYIPTETYNIHKNYKIITNIYRIQHINSNLCGLFSVLYCLNKVDSKNKFISFLTLLILMIFFKLN